MSFLFPKISFINFLIILIISFPLYAQQNGNHLTILLKDQDGKVINNAKVTITFKTNNKLKSDKTNSQGIAKFEKLIDGEYFVIVNVEGFKEYKSDIFSIKSNEHKKLEITLEILPITEKVEVDNIEEERNTYGTSKRLTQEEIENLPDDPEQLIRVLQQMAGRSVTGGEIPINVNGLPISEDNKLPNKEDIKSITIYREIFSAQFEGTSGERIEIETKSTQVKINGSLSGRFADAKLNAKDPFISEKAPFFSNDISFDLKGPINKKASWASGFGGANNETNSAINAIILNSSLQPVNYKTFQSVPRRNRNVYFNIDSSPTEKSTLNLGYSYNITTNKSLGIGGFILPSRAYNTKSESNGIRFNTVYVFNPNMFNSAKGFVAFGKTETFGNGNQVGVQVLDSFYDGSFGTNRKTNTFRAEFYDDFSITLKKTRIGFGFMFRNSRNAEKSVLSNATYTFNGRIAPKLDANNNPIVDAQGNVVTEQINSLESYRRTLLFSQLGFSPTQIRNLGGGASQLSITNGNSDIDISQTDIASYLQMAFPVTKTLAASLGLRYENQTNINSNFDLSPRFGLIWSPQNEKKIAPIYTLPKISVGFGWFYTRFGLENTFSSRRTTDSNTNYYTITNSNLLDSFPNIPSLANIQASSIGRSTLTIDDNFKTPFQRIFNISIEKKLAKHLSLYATFNSANSSRQTITRNINAPLPNTFSEQNPSNAIYPFGNKQAVFSMLSKAESRTNRLTFNFSTNDLTYWKKKPITFWASYSYNQGKSNVVSGNSNYNNAYDFEAEYAPTNLDGVHNAGLAFAMTLPKSIYFWLSSNYSTGQRFNITTGKDSNGDGYYSERPAFASNLNKPGIIFTEYGAFDPNPTINDVIIPRNFARGSNVFVTNMFFTKTFLLVTDKKTKKSKYSFRLNVNINNLFNTNNLAVPVGNISSPNFLRSLNGVSQPRNINLVWRFLF
jgi:hypothetical protein